MNVDMELMCESFNTVFNMIQKTAKSYSTGWDVNRHNWVIIMVNEKKDMNIKLNYDYDHFDLGLFQKQNVKDYFFTCIKTVKHIGSAHIIPYVEQIIGCTNLKELTILFSNIEVEHTLENLD